MNDSINSSRRSALKQLTLGLSAVSLLSAPQRGRAANTLLGENEPAAKQFKYVEDAKRSTDAKPNQTCANCSLYEGATGAAQGGCSVFPNKDVKAAGWCAAWTNE